MAWQITDSTRASARRLWKSATDSSLCVVALHIRGLCVNTCTAFAFSAWARSMAVWIPPDDETWAPNSIG